MRIYRSIITLLIGLALSASSVRKSEKTIWIEVTNPWCHGRHDAPVVFKLSELNAGFRVKSATVFENGKETASQLDDLNGDRKADELAFVADFSANESKIFQIVFSSEKSEKDYPKRVDAQFFIADHRKGNHQPVKSITVPGNSNVYSLVRPHGPALESELVAYRFYFNEKQTPDIYGKFHKRLELKESQFYPDDEQLAQGFGDDVLRVFDSCGAGALKGWNGKQATHIEPVEERTERIVSYGPIRAIAEIRVDGWAYQGSELNMLTRYTLYAGHRDLLVENFFDEKLGHEVFCTGVQNIVGSFSYSDHQGLVGCWGTDWPVNDTVKYAKETVGLGTYIPRRYVKEEVKDAANYLYSVQAVNQMGFAYHITFTSAKETFGYKTAEDWFAHLRSWKAELEHPLIIRIRHE